MAILNSSSTEYWGWILSKVLRFVPGGWDVAYTKFIEFVRALSANWISSIPDLLDSLGKEDVTIEEFFRLERNATFKLTSAYCLIAVGSPVRNQP